LGTRAPAFIAGRRALIITLPLHYIKHSYLII
jgi:hypothetical protein